jgi:hypothetical protein
VDKYSVDMQQKPKEKQKMAALIYRYPPNNISLGHF